MTLNQLIQEASKHYPDDSLELQWDPGIEQPVDISFGDTLALFICRELNDTFDDEATDAEQLEEAIRVIQRAADDLRLVVEGLRNTTTRKET